MEKMSATVKLARIGLLMTALCVAALAAFPQVSRSFKSSAVVKATGLSILPLPPPTVGTVPPLTRTLFVVGSNVGIGTDSPGASLHVTSDDGSAQVLVEETSTTPGDRKLFKLVNNGTVRFEMEDTDDNSIWNFANRNNTFRIGKVGTGQFAMKLAGSGDVEINGTLAENSSREAKENIQTVEGRELLERLARVPVSTWNYKDNDPSIRHMSPMAQDFRAAYGLGASDERISSLDVGGVALASIQALHGMVEELRQRNAGLERENAELKASLAAQMAQMAERLAALERVAGTAAPAGEL